MPRTRLSREKRLPREFVVGYISERALRDFTIVGWPCAAREQGGCDGRLSKLMSNETPVTKACARSVEGIVSRRGG